MLEHASPRVRLRAGQRLEGMSFQDSLEALLQVARRGTTLSGRLQGLWGYSIVHHASAKKGGELCPSLKEEHRESCEKVVAESILYYPD